MMLDVMVDVETLGTGKDNKDVTIIQLSAAFFNRYTGEIYETFESILNPSVSKDFNVEANTLIFWLENEPELLLDLLKNGDGDEENMFTSFIHWLSDTYYKYFKESNANKSEHKYFGECIRLWGFGAMFDNALIRKGIEKYTNLSYPIHHNNDRDIHTLLDLASEKSGKTRKEIKESALLQNIKKHNANDDVKYQANLVAICYDLLEIL